MKTTSLLSAAAAAAILGWTELVNAATPVTLGGTALIHPHEMHAATVVPLDFDAPAAAITPAPSPLANRRRMAKEKKISMPEDIAQAAQADDVAFFQDRNNAERVREIIEAYFDPEEAQDLYRRAAVSRRGDDCSPCDALEAIWIIVQLIDSGCIIDKCISKLMAIMTTVTTTSYAALAATVTVNSLLSETITSYYAPTTETTWSSTIWPTTNQVTVPATRTTTVVQTTFVKRSEGDFDYTVPASAPTAPPAAPAVKRHGGKAHANYNKRAINAVKPAADGAQHQAKRRSDALSAMSPVKRSKLMKRSFCDDLGKFMDFMDDIGVEADYVIADCDDYVEFHPPTLIYFVARPDPTVTVSKVVTRSKTVSVQPTVTTTLVSTITRQVNEAVFSTSTRTLNAQVTENVASAWSFCTQYANPTSLSSLCTALVGPATPTATRTTTSTPPPTATSTITADVITNTKNVAASESGTTLETKTSTIVTGTDTVVVTSAVSTVTESTTSTNLATITNTDIAFTTTTPIVTVSTTQNAVYKRANSAPICVTNPAGWFAAIQASDQAGQLEGFCRSYVGVAPDASETTILVPGISTSYKAGQTVSETVTTGTNTFFSTSTVITSLTTNAVATSIVPITTTETDIEVVDGLTTELVYSTYTETAAASTTFITTRYTCPTRNDGTFPGASTVNALNHFTCYYPDNGECVYANGGAGQLIADVSCLTCPYQMTGAPASGYNHAATIDLTSNLGTSFYVCPSTDIDTSGTVLYNSYMDPSTNAVLCEYGSPSGTTPISQLKSCAYDRGSGSLRGNIGGSQSNQSDNCWKKAATGKCPNTNISSNFNRAQLFASGSSYTCSYTNTYTSGGGPTLPYGAQYSCTYGLPRPVQGSLITGSTCGATYAPPNPNYQCAGAAAGYVDGSGY